MCGVGLGLFLGPQEIEEFVEVAAEHDAHALGRLRRPHVEVAVVVAVICLQAPCASFVEKVFYIEVAYKLVAVERFVAITEVAVENQPVVERSL